MAPKQINWLEIKARYLRGEKPKDIGPDYGVTSDQISQKAKRDAWKPEKDKMEQVVAEKIEDDLEDITSLFSGIIKTVGRQYAEALESGLMGLTTQDGEQFADKMALEAIKAGFANQLERHKQRHRRELAQMADQAQQAHDAAEIQADNGIEAIKQILSE